MMIDPIRAHAIGHTIIRAAVGAHEHRVDFSTSSGDNYVSDSSDVSWVAVGLGEFSSGEDPAHFLNFLCIWVAGYVGESVFAEPDTTFCFTGSGWHQLGRSELVTASSKCEEYATAVNILVPVILEACMEVVATTLLKYQSVADLLHAELQRKQPLSGFRLAALLAAIKEEDLSIPVRQRLGLEVGESS
jgi:hypothetical protein